MLRSQCSYSRLQQLLQQIGRAQPCPASTTRQQADQPGAAWWLTAGTACQSMWAPGHLQPAAGRVLLSKPAFSSSALPAETPDAENPQQTLGSYSLHDRTLSVERRIGEAFGRRNYSAVVQAYDHDLLAEVTPVAARGCLLQSCVA